MTNSKQAYNQLAPHFRKYAKKRKKYLESINQIILKHSPNQPQSILDIGSGDGLRALKLFQKMNGQNLTLIDNSSHMISQAKHLQSSSVSVVQADISDPDITHQLKGQFDVILCLWNVLGHIPSTEKRITSLKNIKSLLSPDGQIFLDINNRYYYKYGLKNIFTNILKDIFTPSNTNGDFQFQLEVADKTIDMITHIFNPFETKKLIEKSGLNIDKRYIVDYHTGLKKNNIFSGQLLYLLK